MTGPDDPPSADRPSRLAGWSVVAILAAALLAAAAPLLTPPPAQAQSVGGFVSPGALARPHAELEGITRCNKCHEPGAGVTAERCLACHESVQDQIDARSGYHADRDELCERCHPDHKGLDFEMVQLDEQSFAHQSTGFALRGVHAELSCDKCHTEPEVWTGLDSGCRSCHEDPHGADASSRTLLDDCRACHDDDDWKALPLPPALFDHDDPQACDYPLQGRHAEVACAECHGQMRFVPVEHGECVDCHRDVHRGQFDPRPCDACHDVQRADFRLPGFDHAATRYPLQGRHREVVCSKCHGRGERARYAGLPFGRCDDCHEDVHEEQFAPRDCDACHRVDVAGFVVETFDHETTGYPLRGGHVEVTCDKCHGEGETERFAGTAFADCADCHQDIHDGLFWPDACATCHPSEADWTVADFDHDRTHYPLDGAHTKVECKACHPERAVGRLLHATCADCHREQDPHRGDADDESCARCHSTEAWPLVFYDHGEATGYELEGAHREATCQACHAPQWTEEAPDLSFRGLKRACSTCHEAARPTGHYEGECGECHTGSAWTPATLGEQGHDVTGFSLRGGHGSLACDDCHAAMEPAPAASPGCVDCHGDDDEHRGMLGSRCEECHGASDWLRTRFRHALTGWSLKGGHRTAACEQCHATGYAGTPQDCWRCHDYERPSDEVHDQGLSRDCELCHRPYDWEDDVRYPHGGDR
jgi:hypothetical protein